MRSRPVALAAALTAAAALGLPATAPAARSAQRSCGTVATGTEPKVTVMIASGTVGCAEARRVAVRLFAAGKEPRRGTKLMYDVGRWHGLVGTGFWQMTKKGTHSVIDGSYA